MNATVRIAEWIDKVATSGSHTEFQDLHITEIDASRYASPDTWIRGGMNALAIAGSYCDSHHPNLTPCLGICLSGGVNAAGINFYDRAGLSTQLGYSPPSIYLFERGRQPWETGEIPKQLVNPNVLGEGWADYICVFSEFVPADTVEYSRSLFVTRRR